MYAISQATFLTELSNLERIVISQPLMVRGDLKRCQRLSLQSVQKQIFQKINSVRVTGFDQVHYCAVRGPKRRTNPGGPEVMMSD